MEVSEFLVFCGLFLRNWLCINKFNIKRYIKANYSIIKNIFLKLPFLTFFAWNHLFLWIYNKILQFFFSEDFLYLSLSCIRKVKFKYIQNIFLIFAQNFCFQVGKNIDLNVFVFRCFALRITIEPLFKNSFIWKKIFGGLILRFLFSRKSAKKNWCILHSLSRTTFIIKLPFNIVEGTCNQKLLVLEKVLLTSTFAVHCHTSQEMYRILEKCKNPKIYGFLNHISGMCARTVSLCL